MKDIISSIPEEIVEYIISYCFDNRNYHFLHYYNFKKTDKICLELNNYVKRNYWWINNEEDVYLKMIDLKNLKSIKKKWKTIEDLKKVKYYGFWRKYYY